MDGAEVTALVASVEHRWGVTAVPRPPAVEPSAALAAVDAAAAVPLIAAPTDFAPYVGKIIRVRGVVENTKVPTLWGLALPQDDLRGRSVLVRGRVVRAEVTQQAIDEANAVAGPIATTGPGVFYSLESIEVIVNEPSDARVGEESTRSEIERLVAVPGVQRSELDSAKVGRAYHSLSRLGLSGFDEFVTCVDDSRRVWPELTQQIEGPTTLGHVCVELITIHVDALYLKKEGLNFVTASNARDWWRLRRAASLPDLQIEALAWYREQRIAETESATIHPIRRRHLVDEAIPDLTRRLEAARRAREEGRPLPIDRAPN
jgi:hypothetical protein